MGKKETSILVVCFDPYYLTTTKEHPHIPGFSFSFISTREFPHAMKSKRPHGKWQELYDAVVIVGVSDETHRFAAREVPHNNVRHLHARQDAVTRTEVLEVYRDTRTAVERANYVWRATEAG